MTQCIALLRGINVGKAKRIAMVELRQWIEDLGHGNVRTLLNSGNVVFEAARPSVNKIAAAIEESIAARAGFSCAVIVLTADTLAKIIDENPMLKLVKDPTYHLVAFCPDPKILAALKPMEREKWSPDALAIGKRAAYLWCSRGVLESRVNKEFSRQAGTAVTARNWATVLKLQALTDA